MGIMGSQPPGSTPVPFLGDQPLLNSGKLAGPDAIPRFQQQGVLFRIRFQRFQQRLVRAVALGKDAGRAVATTADARAMLSLDPVGRVTA